MLKIVGKDVEIITYEEFKDLFIKFGKSIAKNYCEEYYEKDNLQIVIEDLKKISGMYLNNRNLIVINEKREINSAEFIITSQDKKSMRKCVDSLQDSTAFLHR